MKTPLILTAVLVIGYMVPAAYGDLISGHLSKKDGMNYIVKAVDGKEYHLQAGKQTTITVFSRGTEKVVADDVEVPVGAKVLIFEDGKDAIYIQVICEEGRDELPCPRDKKP